MDSTGLGVLVGARKRATAAGMTWRLCGLHPRVQKLLALTGLDLVFSTHPTAADALVHRT